MRQLDLVPPFTFKWKWILFATPVSRFSEQQHSWKVVSPRQATFVVSLHTNRISLFSLDIPHCQAQSFSHDLLPGLTTNYTYEKHIRLHVTHENKFIPFQCNLIADCTQSYPNRFPIFWCFPGNPDWILCTQTFHHHGSPVYTWSSKREHALNF